MRKRLLIALLTAGMALQSLSMPVLAAPKDPVKTEYAEGTSENSSEENTDESEESESDSSEEVKKDAADGTTDDTPEENLENPEEEETDETQKEDQQESTEDDEIQEEEESDNTAEENSEEEEAAEITEEGLEKELQDESLEEQESNFVSSEGVYQEGAFSVLNESGGHKAPGKSITSTVSSVDGETAEEYLYTQLLAKAASINISKYKISTAEVGAYVAGVINDHPDLYFVTGRFNYSYSPSTNMVSSITPEYNTGMDDAAFQTGLEDALATVDSEMTDLEKAITLHDYIVLNCAYDYDNYLNGTIPGTSYSAYGVLVDGTAVCQGYALAYKLLLNKVGIECYMVTSDSMNHAWNLIVLDGEYYQVDTTWDDPVRDRFGLVRHSNMFVSDATFQTRCEHHDWKITKGSNTVNLTADDTRYDSAFWVDVTSPLVLSGDTCYYIQPSGGIMQRELPDGSSEMLISEADLGKWWVVGNTGSYWSGKYSGLFMLGDRLYYNTSERICSVSPADKEIRSETDILSTATAYVYGSAYIQGEVKYVLKGTPNDTAGTILVAELSGNIELPVKSVTLNQESAVLSKGDKITLTATVSPSNAVNKEVTWTSDNQAVAVVDEGIVTAVGGGNCTITASADGKTAKCRVTVRPEKPVFSPLGTVDKGGTVTITSANGEAVYYTVNGQTPKVGDKNTKQYNAPIVLEKDTTIKAIAVNAIDSSIVSDVAEETFLVCTNTLLIDPVSMTLTEGDKAKIAITEFPTTKTEADVMWESSAPNVVSVDRDGMVTALAAGKAEIKASVLDHQGRSVTAVCEVTVELPVYQVTFIGFHDKVIQTVSVEKGGNVTLPDVVAPTGYEFIGWEGVSTNIQNDSVITAQYRAITYSITYHLNGGVNAPENPSNYTIENSIELLPASGKDGFVFVGWYVDEECQKEQISVIKQGSHEEIVLYAKWKDERGLWLKAEGSAVDNEIPAQTYTGSALKPVIEVYYGDQPLSAGKDYTVSYKNNKAANRLQTDNEKKKAPTVVIKGKGNYAGTLTKTFSIEPRSIEGEDVQIDTLAAAYNKGKSIKPVPVVKWNGKKLANKKDFTVEYPDETDPDAYKEPGEYLILVKGCGNYTGTREVKLIITDPKQEVLLSKVKIAKIPDQKYTGQPVVLLQDMPKLTLGKDTLELGTDYTLEYGECVDIGTYNVIITGQGRYKGIRRVSFKIVGESVKNIKISKLPNLVYTGEEVEQVVGEEKNGLIITDKSGNELKQDTDYTLAYSNNRNVGTAKMIITGKGRYTGTVTKTFKIMPCSLENNNAEVQMEFANKSTSQVYQMGGSKPEVKVTFKGEVLTEGVDYTLKYKNNTSLTPKKGIPTVTVTGKKNFKGSRSMTFEIQAKDISDVAITVADLEENTKAGKYMSTPVLTDVNGKKLRAGTDYEKQYVYKDENGNILNKTDRPQAGSLLTVTVKGKGNYTGETTASFRIIGKGMNIAKAKVKINGSFYYTGDNIMLSKSNIVVTMGKKTLQDSDYEIIGYSNNVKKGTAKVTIRGTGEYGGTKQATFQIRSQNMKWWEKLLQV